MMMLQGDTMAPALETALDRPASAYSVNTGALITPDYTVH